jgi:hypothetical protein
MLQSEAARVQREVVPYSMAALGAGGGFLLLALPASMATVGRRRGPLGNAAETRADNGADDRAKDQRSPAGLMPATLVRRVKSQ